MKISDLFDVKYGGKFSKLNDYSLGETPVIKSQGTNNGVIGYFGIEPNYSHILTVARTGSVGACFYHAHECYVTDDCMVLIPLRELSKEQMLLYAAIISKEKYKYNYSRKVTPDRLKNTVIPDVESLANWVSKISIPKTPSKKPYNKKDISLKERNWKWFDYGGDNGIFSIINGFYNKKPIPVENGKIPFIGATDNNNGVSSYHTLDIIEQSSKTGDDNNHDISKKIFKGKKHITISNNGSVGYAFYQPLDFTCSHDVNPIETKDIGLNPFIAMFLCTVIGLERFRWTYGRKWRPSRMPKSRIKLPIDKNGKPDWQFMEDYIKSLPYSSNLESNKSKKGLSDAELVNKYEAGEVDIEDATKKMLKKPPYVN